MDTNEPSSVPFQDIRPFPYDEFRQHLQRLVDEEGFERAIRFIMPEVDYASFRKSLLESPDVHYFQRVVVGGFLEYLAAKTTAGITYSGMDNVAEGRSYVFISNHRDIVLDSAFLNLCFIRAKKPITQIAIGNNLLIYDWIRDIVRLNRCFIVKRDVRPLEALKAARELSAYIHHTVTTENESVWIAQREGRTKDSNDVTQESLIKMLTLGGEGSVAESLAELNITPISISYEFDPNDYLKVKEFLQKRRDPEFRKSQHDDLFSMETGILQFKGRVHFALNRVINPVLDHCEGADRNTVVRTVCDAIDSEIYGGYRIYPINYIAYDRLENTDRFAGEYSAEDVRLVDEYFARQAARIDVDNITDDEHSFIREMFLRMYANPLINQLSR